MKVPLLDLKQQYQTIKTEVLQVANEMFESQMFILGPSVAQFEKEIAAYCNTKHAVGVSSGTDALLIALMAAGIGTDDLVITTPYTFFSTAGSIIRVGAQPIFVDIDIETYNIDANQLEDVIHSMNVQERDHLKAIIPVHLYGQCADMDAILAFAQKHNLTVIEDAAQAIGAEFKGRRAGYMGDMGCFSFFPSKNLGAFGDAGMVVTNDDYLEIALRILRNHGAHTKYYHAAVGGNFRLDALQAAILSVKLKHLDQWTSRRQQNAATYEKLFKESNLLEWITLPKVKMDRHIYNQYVISVKDRRDELRSFLADAGIGTEVYYPIPLHHQECFAELNFAPDLYPMAIYASRHTLALPIFPELTEDQQIYVVEQIQAFFERHN